MLCPTIDREMPAERCLGYQESGKYRCCAGCHAGRLAKNGEMDGKRMNSTKQEETRMGETKICTKCKERKPIERFPRERKGSEKRKGICLDCAAAYQRDRMAKLRDEEAMSDQVAGDSPSRLTPDPLPIEKQAEPTPAKVPAPACPQSEDRILENQLLLDFSCYPEVLREIKRIAHHEERPPEVQARFMLKRLLQDGWGDEVGACTGNHHTVPLPLYGYHPEPVQGRQPGSDGNDKAPLIEGPECA